MPHRRKPKFSGPPGLALPEMRAELDDSSSDASSPDQQRSHDGSQAQAEAKVIQKSDAEAAHPSVASLVREAVAAEMRDLRGRLEDTCTRLERIELLLFRASFGDFARIDSFLSQALTSPADDHVVELGKADAESQVDPVPDKQEALVESRSVEEPNRPQSAAAPQDSSLASFLAGNRCTTAASSTCAPSESLAVASATESCCDEAPPQTPSGLADDSLDPSCPILLHPSCGHVDAAGRGLERSLLARREARRQSTEKLVARARLSRQAEVAVGQIGTLEDLAPSLLVGSLLESTSFMDVLLRARDGSRHRTSSAVIKVTNIQGKVVTFTDGSDQPALDRCGHPIGGQTTMSDEVFCIVGHTKLGGIRMTYAELASRE